ncbi:7680_t:CDS:1, partial [Gigaspora rosea]
MSVLNDPEYVNKNASYFHSYTIYFVGRINTNAIRITIRYLIHQLRIGYLRRVGDRIGERVISFNPSVLTNDYIKTAASSYPEMITCHSPSISMPGTDYFSSKSVMSSAAVSPISTNGRLKTMTSSNGSRDVMTHGDREKSSINNTENGDSDDDIELDENT